MLSCETFDEGVLQWLPRLNEMQSNPTLMGSHVQGLPSEVAPHAHLRASLVNPVALPAAPASLLDKILETLAGEFPTAQIPAPAARTVWHAFVAVLVKATLAVGNIPPVQSFTMPSIGLSTGCPKGPLRWKASRRAALHETNSGQSHAPLNCYPHFTFKVAKPFFLEVPHSTMRNPKSARRRLTLTKLM